MPNNLKKITIWDSDESHPSSDTVILWNGFDESEDDSVSSIQKYIEEHTDELRRAYLAYIYNAGKKELGQKNTIKHLTIREDFSYWWMTLLAEKCNFAKSPLIDSAIKFLALVALLKEQEVKQIELVTTNIALNEALEDWCENNGVQLKSVQKIQPRSKRNILRELYDQLPVRAQAFVWLFYRLFNHLSLAGVGVAQWRESHATTTFVSYLFNLVPEAAEQGKYESRYWAHLPSNMASEERTVRWLHIWVKDKVAPSAKTAKQLIERFNSAIDTDHVHVTLDSFLTPLVVWKTLMDWVRLQWKARKIEIELAKSSKNTVSLWPFMRVDWRDSIKGPTAMSNLLMLNLFEVAFAGIPKQSQGCYLQENQGWEFGCISAWRNAGHNHLIGVPHSTVRYWDLRYFFDPRSYNVTQASRLPLPTRVAVNGPVAKKAYLDGGYPAKHIVEVEALRYLYLDGDGYGRCKESSECVTQNKLLTLCDYLPENTTQQMSLLEKSSSGLNGWEIVIKPHPACPVDIENYPRLKSMNASVTDQPISDLLANFTVAYSSLTTSAAVDAYCAGLSVISALDPLTLNLSPLRGVDGVQFISNSKELLSALQNTGQQAEPKQYFYLDSDLPRWRKLLGLVE